MKNKFEFKMRLGYIEKKSFDEKTAMVKKKGDSPGAEEVILKGIPASPGIVIGPSFVHQKPAWAVEPAFVAPSEVIVEIANFRHAVEQVREDIRHVHHHTVEEYGADLAAVLEMQIAFLEDEVFLKEVEDLIEEKYFDAAYATYTIFRKKKEHFLDLDNEYFRDRAFDIQSLKQRIIANIRGDASKIMLNNPSILVAHTLSPSETIDLHRQKVMGFATDSGGPASHTAIVARSLGVPAVVGLENVTGLGEHCQTVVLDGTHGQIILNPRPETVASYQKQQRAIHDIESKLLSDSALKTATRDGKQVVVQANIGFPEEMVHAEKVNANGVGLFRTEVIFLNSLHLPSENEQTKIYSELAERVFPAKLVIRTLDIGGDKFLPGAMSSASEDNPSLGWRAIRYWLDHEAGFISQLKAILRANRRGNVQLLLPMVSGLSEVKSVKLLIEKAIDALKADNISFNPKMDLGIMIEIPSAVLIADFLAKHVDFFSIGTNDLVQYTLAVDRGNERVARLYSHFHPSVLRMIKNTIDAGKAAGIPVSMCGEMAGDPLAIPLLLAMGLEQFSASPGIIPEVKQVIRAMSLKECHQLYNKISKIQVTAEIIAEVKQFFRSRYPEIFINR